jgi:Histidine kinase
MLEPTNPTTCPDGALLMRELSHRINNEFTSAISVISLTAARSGSSEVKAALSDVSDRLHRYADVHRTLQMPEYQTYVNAALYLQQLCLSISRSRLEPNNITLILAVRPLSIPSDRWAPRNDRVRAHHQFRSSRFPSRDSITTAWHRSPRSQSYKSLIT